MAACIIVGVSGSTDAVYAIRLLQVLRELGAEIPLVVSKSGWLTCAT